MNSLDMTLQYLSIIIVSQVLSRPHRDWGGEAPDSRGPGHLVGGGHLPPGHWTHSSRR